MKILLCFLITLGITFLVFLLAFLLCCFLIKGDEDFYDE